MKGIFGISVVIGAFLIFLYHGLVVKSQRIQELDIQFKFEKGVITEKEYKDELSQINYLSTFLDFKNTLEAIN